MALKTDNLRIDDGRSATTTRALYGSLADFVGLDKIQTVYGFNRKSFVARGNLADTATRCLL